MEIRGWGAQGREAVGHRDVGLLCMGTWGCWAQGDVGMGATGTWGWGAQRCGDGGQREAGMGAPGTGVCGL